MENKIILITNRGVRPNRTGATLFKNSLTKSVHRLRCAAVKEGSKKNRYVLELQPQGEEQDFLTNSIRGSNGRPWVFFVHGNNQTLSKNLTRCFELRELYDVNVLAFSWPSVHYGKIIRAIGYFPLQPNVAMYKTRQFIRKLNQYRKARRNARRSAKDLSDSLGIFKAAISQTDMKANFVCHSLGHRVLKLSSEYAHLSDTLEPFDNILFHQADEDDEDHKDWIIPIGKGNNVVVTTNAGDKVLILSNHFHNFARGEKRRLGSVPKPDEPQPPVYKDFTGMKNLGFSGHTMFMRSASKNPEVYRFFRSIIGGDAVD